MDRNDAKLNKHIRRVHYSGLYPKNYNEKYKELQPDKYAGTAEKVLGKGMTPAGTHVPIMVHEILDFLKIAPGQNGLDATLGYGGHTEEILKTLNGTGHLTAIDADPIELKKTELRLRKLGYGNDILTIRQMNFSEAGKLAGETGLFDFVLADLGVSSMQIDNPSRGFTWKADGPLDLRMNPEQGITAAERLKELTRDELEGMLSDNADEPYAQEISSQIFSDLRHGISVEKTTDLYEEIRKALRKIPAAEQEDAVKKSCARTFQALRIDINHEYESLYAFLNLLPSVLAPGGRIAVLSFHSGEDRLIKQSFREFFRSGTYREISQDVMRPSREECFRNSRAHSAKLRTAVRA